MRWARTLKPTNSLWCLQQMFARAWEPEVLWGTSGFLELCDYTDVWDSSSYKNILWCMSGKKNNLPKWIWYKWSIITKTPKEGCSDSRLWGDLPSKVKWVVWRVVFGWWGQDRGEAWGCQGSYLSIVSCLRTLSISTPLHYLDWAPPFFTYFRISTLPPKYLLLAYKILCNIPWSAFQIHLLQPPPTTKIRLILFPQICNLSSCKCSASRLITPLKNCFAFFPLE